MKKIQLPYRLILGSGSPRRKLLLSEMGFEFETRPKDTDESLPAGISADEAAVFLARKKAAAYSGDLAENEAVITADTVVISEGELLGKPENAEEAGRMLRRLSGKTHRVITGVCLRSREKEVFFGDTTEVTFTAFGEEEIAHYIGTGSPFDKAGAYGAQDFLGMIGISGLSGSYFTVMGLPTHLVYRMLRDF